MASPLETLIRDKVAAGFKGRLLTGQLRRPVASGLDANGDPIEGTPLTYSFEGARIDHDALYRAQAGIPETDIEILIIAGSLDVVPAKDDQLLLRGQWYQVRSRMGDPAGATHTCRAFEIPAPA